MFCGTRNAFALGCLIVLNSRATYAQGFTKDGDHATLNGQTIFAAWNFEAGREIPRDYSRYPEFRPYLEGWDFRINLPHVRFQHLRGGLGGPPAMVGVIEGLPTGASMVAYGHVNNSIWIFRVDELDRGVVFKVLPSRRNPQTNTVENVRSLESGWNPIPGPSFLREQIGAAVVGSGTATVYIAARSEDRVLHFSRQVVTGQSDSSWQNPWTSLDVRAASPPVLAPAFVSRLAMAWQEPGSEHVRVQVYSPATDTWSNAVETHMEASGRPQLLWDGARLNLFFVDKKSNLLKHSVVEMDASLSLGDPRTVLPLVAVKDDHFDVMVFNARFHVVARQDAGPGNPTRLFYTSSTSAFDQSSTWAIPSEVGFAVRAKPEIAYVNDNVFVIGVGANGKARYARKDPNVLGNDLTGKPFEDSWLTAGLAIDHLTSLTDIESISFNGDIYLVAKRVPGDDVQVPGSYVMNFSRAAMKKLLTQSRGIKLVWGAPGGGDAKLGDGVLATFTPGLGRHPLLPRAGEVPMVGDFTGDGIDDLIRFTKRPIPTEGLAPVYVSRRFVDPAPDKRTQVEFVPPTRWHKVFSPKNEIPLVGDFDGDGKTDIVTFVQKRQNFADGSLLGRAPVWVALSDGSRFLGSTFWHTNFSPAGQIPLVGDFDGDGRDDIVSFARRPMSDPSGTFLGSAPVFVALSNGAKFRRSRVWIRSFSPAGEIPLVGDFNGDGLDDIVSFLQRSESPADGSPPGESPVKVALSNGTEFVDGGVWHPDFSDTGHLPRVVDLNLDGVADVVTFVHGESDEPERATNAYVAFSNGKRFGRASTWYSDIARAHEWPHFGSFSGKTLADITNNPDHAARRTPGLATFGRDGDVHVPISLRQVPMPSGAPWEHYKWFTDKGLGVAMFPDWIWDGPDGCLGTPHRFVLGGASGSGGGSRTSLSVGMGSREGHVLEELGHSIWRNCIKPEDAFGISDSILGAQPLGGVPGLSSSAMPLCVVGDSFFDCRNAQHYFLKVMKNYRLLGDTFRARISSTSEPARTILQNQYDWFRKNWFRGPEYKKGPGINASDADVGLQRLPED